MDDLLSQLLQTASFQRLKASYKKRREAEKRRGVAIESSVVGYEADTASYVVDTPGQKVRLTGINQTEMSAGSVYPASANYVDSNRRLPNRRKPQFIPPDAPQPASMDGILDGCWVREEDDMYQFWYVNENTSSPYPGTGLGSSGMLGGLIATSKKKVPLPPGEDPPATPDNRGQTYAAAVLLNGQLWYTFSNSPIRMQTESFGGMWTASYLAQDLDAYGDGVPGIVAFFTPWSKYRTVQVSFHNDGGLLNFSRAYGGPGSFTYLFPVNTGTSTLGSMSAEAGSPATTSYDTSEEFSVRFFQVPEGGRLGDPMEPDGPAWKFEEYKLGISVYFSSDETFAYVSGFTFEPDDPDRKPVQSYWAKVNKETMARVGEYQGKSMGGDGTKDWHVDPNVNINLRRDSWLSVVQQNRTMSVRALSSPGYYNYAQAGVNGGEARLDIKWRGWAFNAEAGPVVGSGKAIKATVYVPPPKQKPLPGWNNPNVTYGAMTAAFDVRPKPLPTPAP